jgi:hypothetical protein
MTHSCSNTYHGVETNRHEFRILRCGKSSAWLFCWAGLGHFDDAPGNQPCQAKKTQRDDRKVTVPDKVDPVLLFLGRIALKHTYVLWTAGRTGTHEQELMTQQVNVVKL